MHQEDIGGASNLIMFNYEDIEEDAISQITRAIEKYEPRALLRNVFIDAQPDRNMIRITIEFQVVNSDEIVTFSTSLSRLR